MVFGSRRGGPSGVSFGVAFFGCAELVPVGAGWGEGGLGPFWRSTSVVVTWRELTSVAASAVGALSTVPLHSRTQAH